GQLVASARGDDTLADRMVRRADIPPVQFRALLAQATEEGRARLVAAAPPARHSDIRDVLDAVAKGNADGAAETRDYAAAIRQLMLEFPDGRPSEADLARFATARNFERTVAALSLVAQVPAELVEQLMTAARLEPVLILCKAVRFKWPTARALLQSRPGPRVSARTLTGACDDFNRLSPASAQQMLRYWQRQADAAFG